jgi:hypothetical protein
MHLDLKKEILVCCLEQKVGSWILLLEEVG